MSGTNLKDANLQRAYLREVDLRDTVCSCVLSHLLRILGPPVYTLQSTSRSVQVVSTHLMIPTYRNRRMNFNCVYFGQQQLTGAKLGGANLLGAIR